MPIIEPPGQSPLSQGDILDGVRLFATARSWESSAGPAQHTAKLCMVLSRPCSVTHKANVVVAAVEKYVDAVPKDCESFSDVRDFLTALRDGVNAPDVFYLGQLPGRQGRYCARMDAIFSIEIPQDEEVLHDFLSGSRIGSLNPDFVRDLHLRIFTAFASLGFHDQQWLSDDDLNWLVKSGEKDITRIDFDRQEAEAAKARGDAEGKPPKQEQMNRLRSLEKQIDDLRAQFQPYLDEQRRRTPDQ
ncbi:MAG: hypothetical protein ACYC6Y_27615 [Thermoguttaceae bacterium]